MSRQNKGYIRNNKNRINVVKKNKTKYDLSIGMIVKNEEKYLERCLQALLPLKDVISCEFIITDTGSTDNTINIAKKYADKFIEFDWCDDFSAARNTGVNVAEGRWFMFVDADEIADSVDAIAEFIKSADSHKYNNAAVHITNYKNVETKEVLNIIDGSRMFNFADGKRYFEGTIHEKIEIDGNRVILDSNFKHYGYLTEVMQGKNERNSKFLNRVLEENPEDISAIKHLVDIEDVPERRIQLCNEGLRIVEEKGIKSDFYHCFHMEKCRVYAGLNRFEEFIKHSDIYYEIEKRDIIPVMEMYFISGFVYEKMNDNAKAYIYFNKYIELYKKLRKKPDLVFASVTSYSFNNERSFIAISLKVAEMISKSNQANEARKIILESNAINYKTSDNTYPFAVDIINTSAVCGLGDVAYEAYKVVRDIFDEKTHLYLMQAINKAFYSIEDKEKQSDYAKGFVVEGDTDPIVALSTLRANNYKFSDCSPKVVEILKDQKDLYDVDIYIDAFYATLITGEDPLGFYEKCTRYQLEKMISGLFQFRTGFEDEIYSFIMDKEYTNNDDLMKTMLFNFIIGGNLMKQVSKAKDNKLEEAIRNEAVEKIEEILPVYVKTTNICTSKLFKDELISDDMIKILPQSQGFCYFVEKVLDKKETQPAEYIAGLKQGVKYYPNMKDCIQLIVAKIQKELDKQNKNSEQFEELGKQIKQMLRMLIRQGNKAQAMEVLEQYKGINPSDEDIPDLMQAAEGI